MLITIVQFVLFCAVSVAAFVLLQDRDRAASVQRRLNPASRAGNAVAPLVKDAKGRGHFLSWVQQKSSLSDSAERRRLTSNLLLAGFCSPEAPAVFVVMRFCLAIVLPFAVLYIGSRQGAGSFPMTIMLSLVACSGGFVLPTKALSLLASRRRRELEYEFPNALDLLVVCVEAGLSIDAAFLRVASEVREAYPRVHAEFTALSEELRAGKSRADGLRSFAARADIPAIKSFVSLLIQSDTLGASIAQTLRTIGVEMRQTRLLKAEERAVKMPVLMTVPLVTCILPVIIAALLLPAGIEVLRTLLPTLVHH